MKTPPTVTARKSGAKYELYAVASHNQRRRLAEPNVRNVDNLTASSAALVPAGILEPERRAL